MKRGIRPDAIATEVRLGRMSRENAATKSIRLLVEGRVMIRRVDGRGVLADVRGDSGAIRRVMFDPHSGAWSCDCPARSRCSHEQAVAAVVVVEGVR